MTDKTGKTDQKPGPQAIENAALDDVSGGAHIDLYRNIWINGTEIPAASREAGETLK